LGKEFVVADEEQLKILKLQGVKAWNRWRRRNRQIRPDFVNARLSDVDDRGGDVLRDDTYAPRLGGPNYSKVNLNEADLREAKLRGASFAEATLKRANLHNADLVLTNFGDADLSEANMTAADLIFADFTAATLDGTDLTGATLIETNLNSVSMTAAKLSRAWLLGTDFSGAHLAGTDFTGCSMQSVRFDDVDLSQCKGLASVRHESPSTIGIDTIYRSGGNIPEVFLRGCGVPEDFITFMKSLVGKPFEFYSCFISYSNKDQEFAERLHADLRSKNVRCWFAPEDLKIGDRLRPSFDEAIRVHDKLMVLLSKNSVSSPWVEKEVETAFEKERREKRTVLFPIRLDDTVMETDQAWATDIRRTRHIGDFRDWKNHDSYKKAFERLLRDLKAEDKGKPA
jgi:uncharacterized protein YjbI with pentapeptide repeats